MLIKEIVWNYSDINENTQQVMKNNRRCIQGTILRNANEYHYSMNECEKVCFIEIFPGGKYTVIKTQESTNTNNVSCQVKHRLIGGPLLLSISCIY